ncbi:hypothetical protein EVAR_96804_1 [Eumeta japonica]|uniref:Uncharacterized protein n=1 Tax=Eumeta variegata TaxID=151549 RepID=A0A4C1WDL6_EUMVA|nr:hypothetical protein EVAR_96804_1 [Eumeta japonica]
MTGGIRTLLRESAPLTSAAKKDPWAEAPLPTGPPAIATSRSFIYGRLIDEAKCRMNESIYGLWPCLCARLTSAVSDENSINTDLELIASDPRDKCTAVPERRTTKPEFITSEHYVHTLNYSIISM